MSKSIGNVVTPTEITRIVNMGSDGLRLWVASNEWWKDMKISDASMQAVKHNAKKIRNTFRFLLGNLEVSKESPEPYSYTKVNFSMILHI